MKQLLLILLALALNSGAFAAGFAVNGVQCHQHVVVSGGLVGDYFMDLSLNTNGRYDVKMSNKDGELARLTIEAKDLNCTFAKNDFRIFSCAGGTRMSPEYASSEKNELETAYETTKVFKIKVSKSTGTLTQPQMDQMTLDFNAEKTSTECVSW